MDANAVPSLPKEEGCLFESGAADIVVALVVVVDVNVVVVDVVVVREDIGNEGS